MAYRLIITERASELLDRLVLYLLNQLESIQGAGHLLDSVEAIYARLEDNPYQFPECEDYLLRKRKYRKAKLPDMAYVVIYRIGEEHTVYIMGVFHELENYGKKL